MEKETIKRALLTIILIPILILVGLSPFLNEILHFFVMNWLDLFCQGVAGAMIVLACWIAAGGFLSLPCVSGGEKS